MTNTRYARDVTREHLAMSLVPLFALASCATGPAEIAEPGQDDRVLRGGVHREPQDFKTPPPLKPTIVDRTPGDTKPAWKKPAVSLRETSPTARAEANALDAGNRDVQDALDASRAASRRLQRDRLAARRAEGRERAKGTRRVHERLAKAGRARRTAAAEEWAKREPRRVQALIDALREEHASGPTGALEAAAQRLHALLRRTAERRRGVADRARERADRARRFAEASASEGVLVPAARVDAKRADRRAIERELEADQAEVEARWAALALRRILRGLLDPAREPPQGPASQPAGGPGLNRE